MTTRKATTKEPVAGKKPEAASWTCRGCGSNQDGASCTECGESRPV